MLPYKIYDIQLNLNFKYMSNISSILILNVIFGAYVLKFIWIQVYLGILYFYLWSLATLSVNTGMVLYIGFVRHVVSQVYVWFERQGLQSLHINISTVSFSYFSLSALSPWIFADSLKPIRYMIYTLPFESLYNKPHCHAFNSYSVLYGFK